uniref:Uncharacterized protein n=1 Tax=Rangifer tarandus platyrhynchus TaxID=3082113 RepID=A0ACB0EX15_RANTA|nr:unnamed protein product [Rangifer tarandus platyrhynchus]
MLVLFRTACPLPRLLGDVAGKGRRAAQGFGVPPKGSERSRGRPSPRRESGSRGSALASSRKPDSRVNEDPGPQLRLPAERLRTPPHRRSPGLAAARLPPIAAAATESRVQPPSPGLSLHSPGSGHRYSSRATSLKCGTTPAPRLWGVGLSSAHAQGGTLPDLRASQNAQTPGSAHALYSLLRLYPSYSRWEKNGVGSSS